jgi:hypothetical protein
MDKASRAALLVAGVALVVIGKTLFLSQRDWESVLYRYQFLWLQMEEYSVTERLVGLISNLLVLVNQVLDRFFGPKLISLRAICALVWLTFAAFATVAALGTLALLASIAYQSFPAGIKSVFPGWSLIRIIYSLAALLLLLVLAKSIIRFCLRVPVSQRFYPLAQVEKSTFGMHGPPSWFRTLAQGEKSFVLATISVTIAIAGYICVALSLPPYSFVNQTHVRQIGKFVLTTYDPAGSRMIASVSFSLFVFYISIVFQSALIAAYRLLVRPVSSVVRLTRLSMLIVVNLAAASVLVVIPCYVVFYLYIHLWRGDETFTFVGPNKAVIGMDIHRALFSQSVFYSLAFIATAINMSAALAISILTLMIVTIAFVRVFWPLSLRLLYPSEQLPAKLNDYRKFAYRMGSILLTSSLIPSWVTFSDFLSFLKKLLVP